MNRVCQKSKDDEDDIPENIDIRHELKMFAKTLHETKKSF
jgi:hypothetical protein